MVVQLKNFAFTISGGDLEEMLECIFFFFCIKKLGDVWVESSILLAVF